MKILLINPPFIDFSQYGRAPSISPCPGTGLSYLYSYLIKYNYNCKIFDFYFDSWDTVRDVLIKENAEIIGITCLTEGRYSAFKLISLIRKIRKDTIIIFGGHHSTYMYNQLLENYDIDFIVLGEGEKKLLKLIKALEGKVPLESVEGIAYKENGKIIKNPVTKDSFISELDELPFPYSEEQMEIFKKYPSIQEIRPQVVKEIPPEMCENGRFVSIITSRGCPFNCQFCSSTLFWGKRWRFRSPKNVVDEIEYYYNKFGFRYFNFADDAFTIIPERSISICKEILNRNLKIYFDCTTRADAITDELVKWLKKAGCLFAAIGVESGSIKILKKINKKITPKKVIRAFTILKRHKLHAYPLLMVGNPGETDETIKKTIILLKIIKPTQLAIGKTTIFPGTDLYEIAKMQDFIDDKYWVTLKPTPYYTYEHSLKKLNKWEFLIQYFDKKKYQLRILKLFYLIKKEYIRFSSLFFNKLPIKTKNFLKKYWRTTNFKNYFISIFHLKE